MSTHKKLTRAERRQIEAAITRAKRQDKKHKSAQDSIPFQRMFPDGICRVTDSYYTKTIQYQDINYQLGQNEDKTAIFDGWCDFLNYFDSSVKFQLSFVNLSATKDSFARNISIAPQGDDFDGIRAEYRDLLELTEARYKKASTIFCSQFDVGGWHQKIGEATLADAICDRIVHDSYRIVIGGEDSMRKRKGISEND